MKPERTMPSVPENPRPPRATMALTFALPVVVEKERGGNGYHPKRATAAEKRHMGRVAALGCALCELLGQQQASKTDVHHIREGQGMAQRAANWLVIPLCHEGCHQGRHGVHGDRSLLRLAKVGELDLLAYTLERLAA